MVSSEFSPELFMVIIVPLPNTLCSTLVPALISEESTSFLGLLSSLGTTVLEWIELIGKWKDNVKGKREFPQDIEFVPGMGVFREEFKHALSKINVHPRWIGIPGKSIRTIQPESFEKTLK